MSRNSGGNESSVPPPATELTAPAAAADRQSSKYATTGSFIRSLPLHHDAEVVVLVLEQPLVRPADPPRLDRVRDQLVGAEPAAGELAEQPELGLGDVPRPGEPDVRRLEQHVPVGPEHLDVPAVQV